MIDLLKTNEVRGIAPAFLATLLLAQAGIGDEEQYEITSFKIDVNKIEIVNRGTRHILRVTADD